MKERARRIVTTLAKLAVALGILAYVVLTERLNFAKIWEADWRLIAWAFVLLLSVPLIGWIRWWTIVRGQGMDLKLGLAFRIQMIGIFFNAFLLGATGGDILKAYYLATGEGRERKAAAVTTVLLDRTYGAFSLFVLVGIVLPLAGADFLGQGGLARIVAVAGAVYGGVLLVIALMLIPRLRACRRAWLERVGARPTFGGRVARTFNEMDEALQEVVRRPARSLVVIGLSILGHGATIGAFYIFGLTLGQELPFRHYVVLTPVALTVNALPIFPAGGLGAGELFASIVFQGVGAAKDIGGTMVFLWRIGLFVPGPLGLLYFVLYRGEIRRAREAAGGDGPPGDCAGAGS